MLPLLVCADAPRCVAGRLALGSARSQIGNLCRDCRNETRAWRATGPNSRLATVCCQPGCEAGSLPALLESPA